MSECACSQEDWGDQVSLLKSFLNILLVSTQVSNMAVGLKTLMRIMDSPIHLVASMQWERAFLVFSPSSWLKFQISFLDGWGSCLKGLIRKLLPEAEKGIIWVVKLWLIYFIFYHSVLAPLNKNSHRTYSSFVIKIKYSISILKEQTNKISTVENWMRFKTLVLEGAQHINKMEGNKYGCWHWGVEPSVQVLGGESKHKWLLGEHWG